MAQNPSSYASAVCEPRISWCTSWVYKKAEEPEIKLSSFVRSWRKQENSRKSCSSASLTMLTHWLCVSQQTMENSYRWEYQTTLSVSWENCLQVKKQQLEPDMEQWTGSKLGKEYMKAVYCHSAYLTYMKSTSREMLGWMKYKGESRLLGEISIMSDTQMTSPLWQKVKGN